MRASSCVFVLKCRFSIKVPGTTSTGRLNGAFGPREASRGASSLVTPKSKHQALSICRYSRDLLIFWRGKEINLVLFGISTPNKPTIKDDYRQIRNKEKNHFKENALKAGPTCGRGPFGRILPGSFGTLAVFPQRRRAALIREPQE